MKPLIGVIGGNDAPPHALALAEEVGVELARRGVSLVCGGRSGVMEAACRGHRAAQTGDAVTIGLLPTDDTASANPHVDIALPTGMGIGRNLLVVRAARAMIVIAGGSGTLSEVAFAWQLGRRIVAVLPSGGCAAKIVGEPLDARPREAVLAASTAREAVELAVEGLVSG